MGLTALVWCASIWTHAAGFGLPSSSVAALPVFFFGGSVPFLLLLNNTNSLDDDPQRHAGAVKLAMLGIFSSRVVLSLAGAVLTRAVVPPACLACTTLALGIVMLVVRTEQVAA